MSTLTASRPVVGDYEDPTADELVEPHHRVHIGLMRSPRLASGDDPERRSFVRGWAERFIAKHVPYVEDAPLGRLDVLDGVGQR
jgi:hypothetical protein